MAQRYFATIEPGLEEALLAEVRQLGGKRAKSLRGGVEFDATNPVFYRMALQLRCANRLWIRVDEFRARDAPELYNKTNRIDWKRLLPGRARLDIRAVAHESRLIHTGLIADTVESGIEDVLGPHKPDAPTFTILARVSDDRCQLSLDASGELLYRRGWKEEVGKAPLRESVAASLLRIAGWEPGQAIYDPMCGSGTFVIEAAQQAAGIPAGASREHAFHQWANFRRKLWDETVAAAEAQEAAKLHFGSDIAAAAVSRAQHNADRAGVADGCNFTKLAVADAKPPVETPGLVIANPPWNRRIEDPGQGAVKDFLAATKNRFDGWRVAFVIPKTFPAPQGFKKEASFEMGGVHLRMWTR